MAQENFDVMISDKEYKQLKQLKQKNLELHLSIKTLEQKLQATTTNSQQLQKELAKKDCEIKYLVEMIHSITSKERQDQEGMTKSVTFQVLGQSIMQPQRAQQRKHNLLYQQFAKKHTNVLKKIVSLEERMESQEELINKLNEMNTQKNQALVRQQGNNGQDQSGKVKKLSLEIKDLMGKIKNLEKDNIELKKQKVQHKSQMDMLLLNFESTNKQAMDDFRKQSNCLLKENENLTKRLVNCNQRLKDMEMEVAIMRKGLGNSLSQDGQTKNRIKAMIDDYVREVELNLKKIEGLSDREIKDLVQHEMKELAEYIPKSIQNKK